MRARGGNVRLVGESYTETQAYAFQAATDEGRTFVAPYDDPLTIAGQGTIGQEILRQLGSTIDQLDAIFVAIGGGGLIAGIAAYVKALKPDVKIIGVEPTGANCMAQSLAHGRRVQLSRVDAFADGVAVKSVGAVRPRPAVLVPLLLHNVMAWPLQNCRTRQQTCCRVRTCFTARDSSQTLWSVADETLWMRASVPCRVL